MDGGMKGKREVGRRERNGLGFFVYNEKRKIEKSSWGRLSILISTPEED